jgi:hypothetical protein
LFPKEKKMKKMVSVGIDDETAVGVSASYSF